MRVHKLLEMLLAGLFGTVALLAVEPASAAGPPPEPRLDVSHVPATDPGSAMPEGWQHGAFIEIFVRSYKDSNGDGIGDLRGLIQSLDYLKELGVRGIWLMPITPSQDHDHGYAVTDYREIDPDYGTLADFDEFLQQAHARGIGVILDYVLNHSAQLHPLFIESSASVASPYRSWYVWREVAPTGWKIFGKDPWVTTANGAYFKQFGGQMPDFNLLNRQVVDFHKDNLRFWLNRGVDGFRFDAVAHLIENGPDAWSDQPGDYALMNEFRALIESYPRRYVVCEAPPSPEVFAQRNVCGSAFLIYGARNFIDAGRGQQISIAGISNYFSVAPASIATILSSHDLFAGDRTWNQFSGSQVEYRLAAASYLLLPGTPFIYYGEEIGMASAAGLSGDPKLRTPMSWTADHATAGFTTGKPYRELSANAQTQNVESERARPDSLLAYYRSLIALRNRYPSIARGSYTAPAAEGLVMSYQRRFGDELAVIVLNYGKPAASTLLRGLPAGTRLRQVYPDNAGGQLTVAANGSAQLGLGPQSVQVFVLNAKP